MSQGHSPAYGSVTGTGAAINISLGFIPVAVDVFNVTTRDGIEWRTGMGNGFGLKTVAAGTRTVISTLGISAYAGADASASRGFTIGADTGVNVATNVIYWVAFGENP